MNISSFPWQSCKSLVWSKWGHLILFTWVQPILDANEEKKFFDQEENFICCEKKSVFHLKRVDKQPLALLGWNRRRVFCLEKWINCIQEWMAYKRSFACIGARFRILLETLSPKNIQSQLSNDLRLWRTWVR